MMQKVSFKMAAAWTLGILLGASFLFAGFPKIDPSSGMIARFEAWGYSPGFAVFIGLVELAGGALVLWPRTAFYGALLLILEMIGAIWTHFSTGIGSSLFAFLYLGLAAALLVLRREDVYWLPGPKQ